MITEDMIYSITDELTDAATSTAALRYVIAMHDQVTQGKIEDENRYDFLKACDVLASHVQSILDTQIDVLDHLDK